MENNSYLLFCILSLSFDRTSGGKGLSPSLGWVRSKKSQLKIPGQPFKVPRLLDQEGGNDVEIVETNLPAPPPLYIFMDKAKLKVN